MPFLAGGRPGQRTARVADTRAAGNDCLSALRNWDESPFQSSVVDYGATDVPFSEAKAEGGSPTPKPYATIVCECRAALGFCDPIAGY